MTDNRRRQLTGTLLAILVLATRLPFLAKTLYEFDSVNFAVALARFDLSEVTPHMPGYILHILLARAALVLTGDANRALIAVSIVLSIGAVLLLWRAAAAVRGERVAFIAALLWLTTPLFWFHGEVAAIYAEEAFWSSAILYVGLKLLTARDHRANFDPLPIVLLVTLSLSAAARQSDLLFFAPAVCYVLWQRRTSLRSLALSLAAFAATTLVWFGILVHESGGLATYLHFASSEMNFKTQSVLFGNSWSQQLDQVMKVLLSLPIAIAASGLVVLLSLLIFPRRVHKFIAINGSRPKSVFVVLVALPALLFYLVVFFMKAGYLLNVVPSLIVIAAVMLDQMAIWLAERMKRRPGNAMLATRRLITTRAAGLTAIAVAMNLAWYLVVWPGTEQERYNNENTRNSFVHGALRRYSSSDERYQTLANRAFEYTNRTGVSAVDSINGATLQILHSEHADERGRIILASWYSRWLYVAMPQATTYDIEASNTRPGAIEVGRASELHRVNLYDSTITIHTSRPVLLLVRHDRPEFESLARQVRLRRLPAPKYLDIYEIEERDFVLKWGDRTFICNDGARGSRP